MGDLVSIGKRPVIRREQLETIVLGIEAFAFTGTYWEDNFSPDVSRDCDDPDFATRLKAACGVLSELGHVVEYHMPKVREARHRQREADEQEATKQQAEQRAKRVAELNNELVGETAKAAVLAADVVRKYSDKDKAWKAYQKKLPNGGRAPRRKISEARELAFEEAWSARAAA